LGRAHGDLGGCERDSILRDPGEVCMSETKAAGHQDYRLMRVWQRPNWPHFTDEATRLADVFADYRQWAEQLAGRIARLPVSRDPRADGIAALMVSVRQHLKRPLRAGDNTCEPGARRTAYRDVRGSQESWTIPRSVSG
jgi:hypothetical protein